MRSKKLGVLAAAAMLLGAASAAWGAFDSPSGESPFGKIDGVKGVRYDGVMSLLFRDYTNSDLTAGGFEATARLTRNSEFHVFRSTYDCESADPCGICDDAALPDRIDVTQIVAIQLCLQTQIAPEILADFALPPSNVGLKRVDAFASEVDPADSTVRVVMADIQVAIDPAP